ncbi:hypothetical protein [Micromonospora sp. IBHARD004]
MTLISGWCCVKLDRPVLVQAGDTVWVEDGYLMVERVGGEVTAHAGLGRR